MLAMGAAWVRLSVATDVQRVESHVVGDRPGADDEAQPEEQRPLAGELVRHR